MLRSRKKVEQDAASLPERVFGGLAVLFPSRDTLDAARQWFLRVLVLAAVVATIWGSWFVRKQVQSDERFYLDTWSLEVSTLPFWVTDEIRSEIESTDLKVPDGRLSVFESGVLDRVRECMRKSPWVEDVSDVLLHYPTFQSPGVLELTLALRRPVAIVERGGLFYLVDSGGIRLGAPYRECPTAWFKVPSITGLNLQGPLPDEGQRWESRDLAQGLEVARILHENGILRDFPQRPIDAIDLSNLHGRLMPHESEVVLRVGRHRLTMGRSPISTSPRTVSVAQLVARLRYVLSHMDLFEDYAVIHLHHKPETITGVRG